MLGRSSSARVLNANRSEQGLPARTGARDVLHVRSVRPDISLSSLISALGLVPGEDPFVLLEGEGWGGSVLAFEPEVHLVMKDASPFEQLKEFLSPENMFPHPLSGGPALFGYISYDAARYLERLPHLSADDLGLPLAQFLLPRYVVGLDTGGVWVSVPQGERPETLLHALERTLEVEELRPSRAVPRSTFNREEYRRAVHRVKEYIRAGDVFQVNISQRLEVPFRGSPPALYEALRRINPSPFGGMVSFPGFVAVSSSPERLVNLSGRRATTRPIAGTYPAGGVDDSKLLLDPKERAEHTMIVDLERNDLGRSCAYGTVQVPEFMVMEAYSHVVHLVSEVSGELAPGKDALNLLAGMFPGGSITGCPKVRCMEIIEEIEPVRRGLYTGSFGYIGLAGDAMDMNIVIRTILLKDGVAYAQAGGGVVADSVPESEYAESLAKAAALLESLGARQL